MQRGARRLGGSRGEEALHKPRIEPASECRLQPALQPVGIAALRQVPIGAHQALGHGVGRGVVTAEHARGKPQQPGFIAPNDDPERFPVAAQDLGDHQGI